jgi:hypothetical protein
MADRNLYLQLNNLRRIQGKKLAKKIKKQKRTLGNDRLKARVMLVNTRNRVIKRSLGNLIE